MLNEHEVLPRKLINVSHTWSILSSTLGIIKLADMSEMVSWIIVYLCPVHLIDKQKQGTDLII